VATEAIEQFAMRARVDQGALVVLAMDLDQGTTDITHQRDAGRLVVDEDPRAAIGRYTGRIVIVSSLAVSLAAAMAAWTLDKQVIDSRTWPCAAP
jgi:hypothetical protein